MRALFAFVVFFALVGVGVAFLDPDTELTPEEAVQWELQQTVTSEDLDTRIAAALEEDDYETALVYQDISEFAGIGLSEDTMDALRRAGGITASIGRTGTQLASGFFTGESESLAGLTGAVASDLTVVGDVRDISREGPAMIAGEPYNELILGLSVVGVGVTGATVATGGGGLPGRVGVSLLKVAAKTGSLTAEFSRVLGRLVSDAVNFPALRQTLETVRLSDTAATREAVTAYARSVRTSELAPVIARMNDIRGSAGAAESVRLMRYVRSTDDLDDIAAMSTTLGRKTRGVIELTGKTTLRAFKTTLNILEFIIRNIISFLSWLGSSLMVLFGRRIFRAR